MLYGDQCASCHGGALLGAAGPSVRLDHPLTALPGTPTVADLAKWIRLNMPLSDPGSLSPAQSLDISAFLLAQSSRPPVAPLTDVNAGSMPIAAEER